MRFSKLKKAYTTMKNMKGVYVYGEPLNICSSTKLLWAIGTYINGQFADCDYVMRDGIFYDSDFPVDEDTVREQEIFTEAYASNYVMSYFENSTDWSLSYDSIDYCEYDKGFLEKKDEKTGEMVDSLEPWEEFVDYELSSYMPNSICEIVKQDMNMAGFYTYAVCDESTYGSVMYLSNPKLAQAYRIIKNNSKIRKSQYGRYLKKLTEELMSCFETGAFYHTESDACFLLAFLCDDDFYEVNPYFPQIFIIGKMLDFCIEKILEMSRKEMPALN